MFKKLSFLIALICLSACQPIQKGTDKQYWYQITIDVSENGVPKYFIGTLPFQEEKLAQALKNNSYLLVTNLQWVDQSGKHRNYSEWNPALQSKVWINSKHVIHFIPLNENIITGEKHGS